MFDTRTSIVTFDPVNHFSSSSFVNFWSDSSIKDFLKRSMRYPHSLNESIGRLSGLNANY